MIGFFYDFLVLQRVLLSTVGLRRDSLGGLLRFGVQVLVLSALGRKDGALMKPM